MRHEIPFILIGKSTMDFFTGHEACSNPGTQVEAQNKDSGAVSQTNLTRVHFLLRRRLWIYVPQEWAVSHEGMHDEFEFDFFTL